MADILDFFSKEAGQARTKARDEILDGILGAAREFADYYLGPTGIPQRASSAGRVAAEMNPVVGIVDAMQASGEGRYGDAALETAMALAPAYGVTKAARPVSEAVQEILLGASSTAGDAGKAFVERMNQRGPVPTMYSNPIDFMGQSKKFTQDVFNVGPSQPDRSLRRQADDLIESGSFEDLPAQSVPVSKIIPTQRFLGAENMDRVSDATPDTGAYLIKQGDQYFVLDGHHRIAKNIAEGVSEIKAKVFDSTPSLPPARNEAEAMAKRILDMRASGNAADVTDEMMAASDPQYMFFNTPLPMDYESRMKRAIQAGFDVNDEMYRGDAPMQSFKTGRGQRDQIGVTMSSRPDVAASYIPAKGEGGIYPLMSRGKNDAVIEGVGQNWNVINPDAIVEFQRDTSELSDYIPDNYFEPYDVMAGTAFTNTNDVSRMFQGYGADRVRFNDIVDRGGSAKYYGPESSMPSDVMMVANPSNVRSRFALFDPEFAHLKNISASVGLPISGILGYLGMSEDDAQHAEQQMYEKGLLE
jgi:hypothetical protein